MDTLHRFKSALREGKRTAPTIHKTAFDAPEPSDEARVLRFVASSPAVDRDGDTISPAGWELDNYRKNPVILWAHRSDQLPIGKAVALDVVGDRLIASVEFVPADMPVVGEMAEAVYRMCRDGFLCATSVGFRPIDADFASSDERPNGVDFKRQELMEISITPCPSNPEALLMPDVLTVPPTERAAEIARRKTARARRQRIAETVRVIAN